jgi:NADH-quinone oxidoreductase subunit C
MADESKTPPEAAADKPSGTSPAEPLKGEVSPAPATPAAPAVAKPVAPAPAAAAPAATAGKAALAAGAGGKAPAPAKAAPHPPPAAAPPSGPTDPPPPADAAVPAYIASLQLAVSGSVEGLSLYLGDWTILASLGQIEKTLMYLRDARDAQFDYLSDLTATDWPPRKDARFDVVYCLYSTRLRHRVRVKVKVGEQQGLPSATSVWPAANWLEREVWDMFGVNFTGHPDRRRILMPEDWQGFPQRKDYPLEGPGELLMENPVDWLKLRQAKEEADIE